MHLQMESLQYQLVSACAGCRFRHSAKNMKLFEDPNDDETELMPRMNDDVEVMTMMKQLHDLVANGEEWLLRRVIQYATERNYVQYTATLSDAWRISISGLSRALLSALDVYETPPEIGPNDDYSKDPIASFGILEAKRHRQRGVTLGMFLGLMKYYRQSYMDLISESDAGAENKARYSGFVNRSFDRIEIGFCEEWNTLSNNEVIAELQSANRFMVNEKNKYLTIFESIQDPVVLFDHQNRVDDYNHSASLLFFGSGISGTGYYDSKRKWPQKPWLTEELTTFFGCGQMEYDLEKRLDTRYGKRLFEIKLKRMLDISNKFEGTVALFTDITARRQEERMLQKLTDDLKERVKELDCMYGISHLVERPNITLAEIIQGIVDIMRSAWRYPEITSVQIVIGDQRYQTSNFKKTKWRQVSLVKVGGEPIGFVTVHYIVEKPDIDEGPFSKEERCLIDAIAIRLGQIIERKTALEALCESEKKLSYLSSHLMAAQESERKRIAVELHDDLGQCLTFLKLRIQSFKNNLAAGSQELANEIEDLLQFVQEILEKVRNLYNGLIPSFLDDLGLRVSLESLAERFAENTRMHIPLELDDIDCLFSPLTEVIIYRIFQEALTNIEKNSHAKYLSIVARKNKKNVSFTLEYDGTGSDLNLLAVNESITTGIGLTSIKERVRMLNGHFMLESARRRGTRLSFTVPIEKKTARPDRLLLHGV